MVLDQDVPENTWAEGATGAQNRQSVGTKGLNKKGINSVTQNISSKIIHGNIEVIDVDRESGSRENHEKEPVGGSRISAS